MTINNHTATAEFNLAAFLLSKDCRLVRLDRTTPKRTRFIFNDVPSDLIDSFWSNGTVGVTDFISAQRELKQRLFADTF